MRTIAVVNYKGGVGKTVFSICIAQALAITGYRVLTIDNDCQHNLSLVLGEGTFPRDIRAVYQNSVGNAGMMMLQAIRETRLRNLHVLTSNAELCNADVKDPQILRKAMSYCSLSRFYDYVIIDNHPGLDVLQETAVDAADELFIPTELSHFALSGINELNGLIASRFRNRDKKHLIRIIPNFYKGTKRQDAYLEQLRAEYGKCVTATTLPYDSVFEACMKDRKTLFINHLFSKAAAYYLKLIHELFDLSEEETWEHVQKTRKEAITNTAREHYYETLGKPKVTSDGGTEEDQFPDEMMSVED